MRNFKKLVQLAYSGEKAAAFAYYGHSNSVVDPIEKNKIKMIEKDEWAHRENLKRLLFKIDQTPSLWYELKFAIIGKLIGASCHFIGWFIPMYFAGRLESKNVNEYVVMGELANQYGLFDEVECIKEMALVEKQHELFFLEKAATSRAIFIFEKLFKWGPSFSFNNYSIENENTPARTL
jgi:demethoxyubiquinone hydroxylase (CLK1/Coq7/Cat5 family)